MADIIVKRRVMAELTIPTLCDLIRGKSGGSCHALFVPVSLY